MTWTNPLEWCGRKTEHQTIQRRDLHRVPFVECDHSALLERLAQLRLTDVTDQGHTATETLYQELITAEANAFISARFERSDGARRSETGAGPWP